MLVEPGTVTDTTGSPRWEPVRVVAHLAEPVINLDAYRIHLDGPAAFAGYLQHVDVHGHHSLPLMGHGQAVDFDLPLATWTALAPSEVHDLARAADPGQVWGWACSAGVYEDPQWTVVDVRRKPDAEAMHRYAPDRKVHLASGPLKARNVAQPATLVREIVWWALADQAALQSLLDRVPGLGRLTRHGNGKVLAWDVVRDEDAHTRWRERVWPDPAGQPEKIRAPYHHHSREMPAALARSR